MIVDVARTWIGTPYVHQARGPKGPEGGVDCVGLLIGVCREMGLIGPDYDPNGYAWETDGTQLHEELHKWLDLQGVSSGGFGVSQWSERLQPGDIAVLKLTGLPQHAAIISEIDYGPETKALGMIHSYNGGSKTVIEHRIDDRWARRIVSLWRLRG